MLFFDRKEKGEIKEVLQFMQKNSLSLAELKEHLQMLIAYKKHKDTFDILIQYILVKKLTSENLKEIITGEREVSKDVLKKLLNKR